MYKRALSILLLFALASGCALFQEGTTSVVKFDEGTPPKEVTAPVAGQYSLYSSTDVEPQFTVELAKGDALGFRRDDESGRIVAVAGGEEWALEGQEGYYWRRR